MARNTLKYSVWARDPDTHTYIKASEGTGNRAKHWGVYKGLLTAGIQARFITENPRVDTPVIMKEAGQSEWPGA